jgi:hypothetical protein
LDPLAFVLPGFNTFHLFIAFFILAKDVKAWFFVKITALKKEVVQRRTLLTAASLNIYNGIITTINHLCHFFEIERIYGVRFQMIVWVSHE